MVIKKLSLVTGNLSAQTDFYAHILGLSLLRREAKSVIFKIGYTELEISESNPVNPYHFAINIPSNQAMEAMNWLRGRLTILRDGKNELIDFKSWNAESIYFYDPDHNIVELISRKNLGIRRKERFSQEQFLGISEIGMPVEDIEKTFKRLKRMGDIDIYDGNFDNFCAIGDENGLFIVVNQFTKKWFPTQDDALPAPFSIKGDFTFSFKGGRFHQNEIGL